MSPVEMPLSETGFDRTNRKHIACQQHIQLHVWWKNVVFSLKPLSLLRPVPFENQRCFPDLNTSRQKQTRELHCLLVLHPPLSRFCPECGAGLGMLSGRDFPLGLSAGAGSKHTLLQRSSE
jgi:hypothetical protein